MTDSIVQILRPDGKLADGIKAPQIGDRDLLKLYRTMLFTRRLDQRMITLQRQGRIGFYIGSIGEEAAVVGSAFALRANEWIIPAYRELGAALLRGFPIHDFCCQLFGNREDPIQGRQMPNHFAAAELYYGSVSSPVGTQIPQATGVAWAAKILGKKEAVLVYFGDGATSQGDFHVGLNFAATFKVPAVFFCRNNQWAISVPLAKQTASKNLAIKGLAYGIDGVRVDGNDLLGVYSVTRKAVEKARRGDGPTLIEAVTYRMSGHSTSDDPRAYRDAQEVDKWEPRDPLRRLKNYLINTKRWSEKEDQRLEKEIQNQILDNIRQAEAVGSPDVDSLFQDVFDQQPWHLTEQQQELENAITVER